VLVDGETDTDQDTDNNQNDSGHDNAEQADSSTMITFFETNMTWVIVAGSLLLLCCLIIPFVICRKRKQKSQAQAKKQSEDENEILADIATQSAAVIEMNEAGDHMKVDSMSAGSGYHTPRPSNLQEQISAQSMHFRASSMMGSPFNAPLTVPMSMPKQMSMDDSMMAGSMAKRASLQPDFNRYSSAASDMNVVASMLMENMMTPMAPALPELPNEAGSGGEHVMPSSNLIDGEEHDDGYDDMYIASQPAPAPLIAGQARSPVTDAGMDGNEHDEDELYAPPDKDAPTAGDCDTDTGGDTDGGDTDDGGNTDDDDTQNVNDDSGNNDDASSDNDDDDDDDDAVYAKPMAMERVNTATAQ